MKTLVNKINTVLLAIFLLCAAVGSSAFAATPGEIETSIEAGINWLAAQQNTDGSWVSWVEDSEYPSSVSPTAFAVIKLAEYALEVGYDSPFDPCYPYNMAVEEGLGYIYSHAHIINISPQPAGNPDGDGDGNGVHFGDDMYYWEEIYNTGIVMMAIAATQSPDRIVVAPGSPVDGWTYKQVLDDVVDYMAFGQTDEPSGQGGWGYFPNGGDWGDDPCEPTTTYSDNSNTGFVVLGLAYAESEAYGFNCVIPQFVRNELNIWIDHIQTDGGPFDGGSGYEEPGEWVNALKTGNLIFEMAFYGDGPGVPRMQSALDYLARIWNHPSGDPGWKGPPPQYQAMYCIMKGLEYRGIDGILTYPVAQRVTYDVDMFEVNGLGTSPVDIEVVSGDLDTMLGLFDSNGTLGPIDDDGGFDDLSRLANVTPENGKVRFGITGEDDIFFRGWHRETGTYQVAVWPSGSPAPNEPLVDESESNNEFINRDVFASAGQIVINAVLGDPEYFPPEGEPIVINWYDDLADIIVATQNPDGSWPADAWGESGDSVLTTAWALLTLEKVTPPVAMIYGQCILAGESFEPTNLDEGINPENPGVPPYTWTVMGNVVLSVDIDANNVMTVTYPEGWTGSETLTLICVDAAQQTYIIPYPYPTYAVCSEPVVLDIPDQMYPFEPFDLDDYLDPACGLEPNEIEWSVSGVSEGWNVDIDANNVVTVTASQGAVESATFIFTATSTVCICAELSDSNDATFTTTIPPYTGNTIFLTGGTLAGQPLSEPNWAIDVQPGESISGNVLARAHNAHRAGAVVPFGYTWTWGARESAIVTLDGWIPTGTSNWNVPINLSAPLDPGTYYILFGLRGEYTMRQVLSATNWTVGSGTWHDDNDYHDMTDEDLIFAHNNGHVADWTYLFTDGYRYPYSVAVMPIKVTVIADTSVPTADADGPYTIYVGDVLTLDASGSTDDDNDIVSYMWDLDDDGTFETDAGDQAVFDVNYAYLESLGLGADNTYTILLKVTDSEEQSDINESTLTILSPLVIEVSVDIKPTSCPNPLNVNSQGVLPVAILGSGLFDVNDINVVSIELLGVSPIRSSYEDVATPLVDANECECSTEGPDGYMDLTLKFETQAIVEALGEVSDGDELILYLTGLLYDEAQIEGSDCIIIRKKSKR